MTLSWTAKYVSRVAISSDLPGMTSKCLPAFNLNCIDVRQPSSEVIPAIPLKPTPWIWPINPTFLSPNRERLSALNTKVIQRNIRCVRYFCLSEPECRKLVSTIVAIFAFKYAHFQHFTGRKMRFEVVSKIFAKRRNKLIAVAELHSIVNGDDIANRHKPSINGNKRRTRQLRRSNFSSIIKGKWGE